VYIAECTREQVTAVDPHHLLFEMLSVQLADIIFFEVTVDSVYTTRGSNAPNNKYRRNESSAVEQSKYKTRSEQKKQIEFKNAKMTNIAT